MALGFSLGISVGENVGKRFTPGPSAEENQPGTVPDLIVVQW